MKALPIDFELQTERLRLRGPREEDAAFVFDASRHPAFTDGMLWDPPASVAECHAALAEAVRDWRGGETYTFTSVHLQSAELVGRVSLREGGCGLSVGFWVHPQQQGRGYATEALKAALDLAFGQLGASSVAACHADWNLASRRVLDKAGFQFRGRVEQGFLKRGEWVAEESLALTRQRWEAIRAPTLPTPGSCATRV